VPAWLFATGFFLLVCVVLVQFYWFRTPVDIWGLKLIPRTENLADVGYELTDEVTADRSKPRDLGDTSDRICWLAGVWGRFAGNGESALVTIDNGRWVLRVTQGEMGREIAGAARCLALKRRLKPSDPPH
jgi:hypothetical protein